MHQSYQQLASIVDLASDGRRVDVNGGIEAVKFAGVVQNVEVVKYAEVVKCAEDIKLVETDEVAGYVTLGEKEVLML